MIPRRRYNLEPSFLRPDAPGFPQAVKGFEDALVHFLQADDRLQARATASGRASLALLLKALKVPCGSCVMLPAYTLGAMAPFIQALGFKPVTCDVDECRPVMTANSVERAWPEKDRVGCVLATHLFGIPADVPAIKELSHSRGALVIEDCAHSIGSRLRGQATGTLADGALFSFSYLKQVNGFGGGAAVLPSGIDVPGLPPQSPLTVAGLVTGGLLEDLMFAGPWLRIPTAMLAFDRLSGIARTVDRIVRRPPNRGFALESMSPVQAAHGLASLDSFPGRVKRRLQVAIRISAAAGLDTTDWLENPEITPNAYFLTLRTRDAAGFRRRLWMDGIDAGIGTEVADYVDCPGCPEHPSARRWYRETVQIPCHETLSDRQIIRIADAVRRELEASQASASSV
ncbi:DegT/DnrJ/EryC1/StrS family aminotransferase [Myxococcota bacterium]|nr:DegT/DnrJ/EryC1/StrS family aminotransferase [Myxococcota bacterium]